MDSNKQQNEIFYIQDKKKSINVNIDLKQEITVTNLRGILSFCKQWQIQDIVLKIYDVENKSIFDHLNSVISDSFLFKPGDFNFYLYYANLENYVLKQLWKNNIDPAEFLLPFLIHSENYEQYINSFGSSVVNFFNSDITPITLNVENNKITTLLKNPDTIFALFIRDNTDKNAPITSIDLKKHFNPKIGKLVIPWKKSKSVDLYVLRKINGFFEGYVRQKINFYSEKILKLYFEYLQELISDINFEFYGVYLNLFSINPSLNQSIPLSTNIIKKFSDKKAKDFSNSVLSFWYSDEENAHHKCVDLFNFIREEIQVALKKSLGNQTFVKDKNVIFKLYENGNLIKKNGLPFYLFDFANTVKDFSISLDDKQISPNSKYCQFKETELKIASSISHHFNKNSVSVKIGNLLNTKHNFENKLWYINWMISCGINNLLQSVNFDEIEKNSNLYANLPSYDPSYKAYSIWFNYINTICHFAAQGDHRCDILVLYPIESFFYGETLQIPEVVQSLTNRGLDFDFIDYNSFVDKNICKISNSKISINKEQYSILILPGTEIIPIEVLEKIHEFYMAGGTVIAIGNLPTKSTEWDKDNEIESISNEIWFKKSTISSTKFKTNKWGGKGYFQSDIKVLADILNENKNLLSFKINETDIPVSILVRETENEYYFLLFNRSAKKDFSGVIQTEFKGQPFVWDFEKNETIPYFNFDIKKSNLHMPVTIHPKQIKVMIVKKQSLKSIPKIIKTNLNEIVDLKVLDQNVILKARVKSKGKYETEINLFNIRKSNEINIKQFLPVLAISNEKWNIEFNNKKIISQLGDLSRHYYNYCGKISYKKIIVITETYLNEYKLILDLGKVQDTVEIIINDNNLGMLVFPPFKIDITDYILIGDNKFEFIVRNNLYNEISSKDVVNQEKFYIREFGLFGPVKLIPLKEVEINC